VSASPAVAAFDAIAGVFDQRFSAWQSVSAQRRAVRRELLAAFPKDSNLLELGGGTGEDAIYLAQQGRNVLLTDGASSMVSRARAKVTEAGLARQIRTRQLAIEELSALRGSRFDGAYSNFAAFNCVSDRQAAARSLAELLPARAQLVLVVFGTLSVGEIFVQLARGDSKAAFRRFQRGAVPARVGGTNFTVEYPTIATLKREFAPCFRLVQTRGIGVFVPPSAAEPEISRWPRVLRSLEALDRLVDVPLARLADHVLLRFVRTEAA
jgi:SAM-dependent methyltransferase